MTTNFKETAARVILGCVSFSVGFSIGILFMKSPTHFVEMVLICSSFALVWWAAFFAGERGL